MNATKKDWPHSTAVTQKLLHKFQCKLWECPACNTKALECDFHLFDEVKNDVIEIYVVHDEEDTLWVIWRSKKVLNIPLWNQLFYKYVTFFLYILCNLEVSVYLESIYIKFHFVYISSLEF